MFVPVVTKDRKPLMPTTPSRARRWIESGRATPFWKKGVFCVCLNTEPSGTETQEICVGVDPGSKREGFTVKSASHTYLNILADAVDWVKDKVETRRNMRRARRYRNTPCRQNRMNRSRGSLPPSTKARWQLKLRIAKLLTTIFPVSSFNVEDVKAVTKGKRKWDASFSPLECGKNYFYGELSKLGEVVKTQGHETHEARTGLGLRKSKGKLDESFDAHNVDSWVLANMATGGHVYPENKAVLRMIPLNLRRRQLHILQFAKGGVRRRNGGTMSLGFKRGSLVKHSKHGLCFIGGTMGTGVSLHVLANGKRLCQNAKTSDIKFLSYSSFRFYDIKTIAS